MRGRRVEPQGWMGTAQMHASLPHVRMDELGSEVLHGGACVYVQDAYGYGQQMGGYPQGGYGMDRPHGGMSPYDRPGMGMGGMGNIGGMGMGMPNMGMGMGMPNMGMGMGMNMQEEAAWAAQGYPVPGPNGWTMYRAKDSNEPYFHNHNTNVTIWERPDDWPLMTSAMGGMP
eukprot:359869-Chlamydomonas_euryale.AAC.40